MKTETFVSFVLCVIFLPLFLDIHGVHGGRIVIRFVDHHSPIGNSIALQSRQICFVCGFRLHLWLHQASAMLLVDRLTWWKTTFIREANALIDSVNLSIIINLLNMFSANIICCHFSDSFWMWCVRICERASFVDIIHCRYWILLTLEFKVHGMVRRIYKFTLLITGYIFPFNIRFFWTPDLRNYIGLPFRW